MVMMAMIYIILIFVGLLVVFWVYLGHKSKATIKQLEGVPELVDKYITELYQFEIKNSDTFSAVPIQSWQSALGVASAISISGFIEMTSFSDPTKERLSRNAYDYIIHKYDCFPLYAELSGLIEQYRRFHISLQHSAPELSRDLSKPLVEGWIFKNFFGRLHDAEKDEKVMYDIAIVHDALLNAIRGFMK